MTTSNPISSTKIDNLVFATSNTGSFSVGGKMKFVQRFKYFDEVQNKSVVWDAKENKTLSRDQIVRIELLLIEALKFAVDQETNLKESDQKSTHSEPDFWNSWKRMTIETGAKPEKSRLKLYYSQTAEVGKEKLKKYRFSHTPPNPVTIQKADEIRRNTPHLHLNLSSLDSERSSEVESKSGASNTPRSTPSTPRAGAKPSANRSRHKARRSVETASIQPNPPEPKDERSLNLSLTPGPKSDLASGLKPKRSKKRTVEDVNRTAAHQLGQRAAESKRARSSEAS